MLDIVARSITDDTAVLTLSGRLDSRTADVMRTAITDQVGSGRRQLVVDMGRVAAVDSSGIGALINGLTVARKEAGDVRLAGLQRQARSILRHTRLDTVLVAHGTTAEALRSYA